MNNKKRKCRRMRKSRTLAAGIRRGSPSTAVERRVRALKKLIPNSESMGTEGLFRETAEYIVALEMRVTLMHIMVQGLTSPAAASSDSYKLQFLM
ncbi:Transcription factor UPBEAT1 [Linum perenne]